MSLELKKVLINSFMTLRFSHFFWITPNKSKCEIGGIGILKGIQIALCGMKCVNLKTNIITIIEIHFSYNTRLEIFFAKTEMLNWNILPSVTSMKKED